MSGVVGIMVWSFSKFGPWIFTKCKASDWDYKEPVWFD